MAEQRTPLDALPACAAAAGTGQRQITHLGFNGELCELLTGHYLLGNGYRAFNPVLMRFNSPDHLSPFEGGGINAYAYCQGDPVSYRDPHGMIKLRVIQATARRNPRLNRLLDRPAPAISNAEMVTARNRRSVVSRVDTSAAFAPPQNMRSASGVSEVAGSSVGDRNTVLNSRVQVQVPETSRRKILRSMPHVARGRLTPGQYFKKPASRFMSPPKSKPVDMEYFRESEAGERLVMLAPSSRETTPEPGLSLQAVKAAVAAVRS